MKISISDLPADVDSALLSSLLTATNHDNRPYLVSDWARAKGVAPKQCIPLFNALCSWLPSEADKNLTEFLTVVHRLERRKAMEERVRQQNNDVIRKEARYRSDGFVLVNPDGEEVNSMLPPGVLSNLKDFVERMVKNRPGENMAISMEGEQEDSECLTTILDPMPDQSDSDDSSYAGSSSESESEHNNSPTSVTGKRKSPQSASGTRPEVLFRRFQQVNPSDGICWSTSLLQESQVEMLPRLIRMRAPCQSGKTVNALMVALILFNAKLIDRVLIAVGVGHQKLKETMLQDSAKFLGTKFSEKCVDVVHLPNLTNLRCDARLKRTLVIIDEAHWGLKHFDESTSSTPTKANDLYLSKRLRELGFLDYEWMKSNNLWVVFLTATPGALAVNLDELGEGLVMDYLVQPGPSYLSLNDILNHPHFADKCSPFDPEIPEDSKERTKFEKKYLRVVSAEFLESMRRSKETRFNDWLQDMYDSVVRRMAAGGTAEVYHWMRVGGTGGHNTKHGSGLHRFNQILHFLEKKGRAQDFAMVLLDSDLPDTFPAVRDLSMPPSQAISLVKKWLKSLGKEMYEKYSKRVHVHVGPNCTQMIVVVNRFHYCAERVCTDYVSSWTDRHTFDTAALTQSVARQAGHGKELGMVFISASRRQLSEQSEYEKTGSYAECNYQSPSVHSNRYGRFECVLGNQHSAFVYEGISNLPDDKNKRAQQVREVNERRRRLFSGSTSRPPANDSEQQQCQAAIDHVNNEIGKGMKVITIDGSDFPWLKKQGSNMKLTLIQITEIISKETGLIRDSDWRALMQSIQPDLETSSNFKNPLAGPDAYAENGRALCKLVSNKEPTLIEDIIRFCKFRWSGANASRLGGLVYHGSFTRDSLWYVVQEDIGSE